MESLSKREKEVLRLIAGGRSTKQLAADLGITFKTASCHRNHVLRKLDATNTADLMCRAFRLGLIDLRASAAGPTPEKRSGTESKFVTINCKQMAQLEIMADLVAESRELRKKRQAMAQEMGGSDTLDRYWPPPLMLRVAESVPSRPGGTLREIAGGQRIHKVKALVAG